MAAHPVRRIVAGAPQAVLIAVAAHEGDPEALQPPDKRLVELSDLEHRERVRILPELLKHSLLLLIRERLKVERGGIVGGGAVPYPDLHIVLTAVELRLSDARGLRVALIADDGVIREADDEAAGKGDGQEALSCSICRSALPAPERLVSRRELPELLLIVLLKDRH